MNDFWHGLNKNEPAKQIEPKKRPTIDGISPKSQKSSPLPKIQNKISPNTVNKKKKPKYGLFIVLGLTVFIIALFCGSGYYIAKAQKDKINIAKLVKSGKYLVLFQNNAEMRASGGFIGSFAVISISDYKLQRIDFNSNIYKLDSAYSVNHQITPPNAYDIFTDSWTLRDANYAVSFPDAASQIQWFYNQETGDSVDGVIAINASVVQDLLKNSGPIKLANYDTPISADNFFTYLTTEVEQSYFATSANRDANEPKSILITLMPELVKKAIAQNKIALLKQIYSEIQQKQILLFSNNQNIENSILTENWGGEIKKTNGDYLAINDSNIGGNKSSLHIKETIDYKVINMTDNLIGNLILTRSHSGSLTWPDGTNTNYSRILAPEGSTLVSATLNGKDITSQIITNEEAGKTVFALTFVTAPQTSDVLNLSYNLPKTVTKKNYSLFIQKQPGNLGDDLSAEFEGKILYDGILNTDKYLAAL